MALNKKEKSKSKFFIQDCFLYVLFLLLFNLFLFSPAFAQGATQVGTVCSKGGFSADFDKIVHCTSTNSSAGTFQAAPVFIGSMTASVYADTACTAARAGLLQSNGSVLQYCNGTAWQNFQGGGGSTEIVGEVKIWPTDTLPSGYLECNGAAISRTTYAALFTVLGVTYGAGDGSTTFNLPDYRGMFLRGWDNGAGVDPDALSRTDRGDGTSGNSVGTKQASANKAHTHSVVPPSATTSSSGGHGHTYTRGHTSGAFDASGSSYGSRQSTTGTTGGGGAHTHSLNVASFTSALSGGNEGRPSNAAIIYIIKH